MAKPGTDLALLRTSFLCVCSLSAVPVRGIYFELESFSEADVVTVA
jgi:hypothetical protein